MCPMGEIRKFAKYAQILKNSVASKETANERIFLMKDRAAVEGGAGDGMWASNYAPVIWH